MKSKSARIYPILLLILAFSVGQIFAQNITGTILGTVRDSSRGVMPGSAVSLTNEETNVQFSVIADDKGDFVFPNLAPGIYTVKTEAAGFKQSLIRGVRLLANRSARVDVVLETGAISQEVQVQATAPVVNSENATIGNVMESKIITTLPLNGRTLDRLIRISAGVTTDSASNPRVAGSSYWGGIHFNVDGVSYNDLGNGGAAYSARNGASTLPSIDVVSEFKIDSNNQKAEFEGSASVTIVTKSGTNALHGSLFEFNRNKAYAAKNFFATGVAKPPYNRNEFGFALGGPVRKERTFFFGSYEGLRERFPRTNTLSVGTAAMRDGDFSGLPAITDPLTGQPFPNNRIPSNRIDARAQALLKYVPPPNPAGTGPAGTLNNYVVNIANISDINRYGVRLDHKLTDQDSLWGSFNYSKGSPYVIAQAYPPDYGSWGDGGYQTENLNLTHNHTFSARTMNEFRFGWFYHGSVRQGMNTDFDPRTIFPTLYGPLPVGGLPNVAIAGHVSIGDYGGSGRGKQFTNQYIDNFTMVRGRHTIKTGIDFANYRVSSPPGAFGLLSGLAQEAGFGRFTFTGRYASGNAATAAPAHAFADFILGYPVTTYRSTPSAVNLFYQTRYSAYIQDDWQASPRLTLNFGVRYMVQTSWKERDRAQANFDFASGRLVIPGDQFPPQTQPRLVATYPIVTSQEAGLPDDVLETDKNNFAPRIGFAFRPFADNRTVIRGGAGFYYNTLPAYIGFRQMGFTNPPFLLAETFEAAAGAVPSLTLEQPFPGAGALSPNPAITAVERDIKNSLAQQWNLTLERELTHSLGFRVSYVGNKTSHLPWYNRSINVPEQQAAGVVQPRRPFQPWADILLLAGGGDSTIHQLQVEGIQRYAYGLNFQAEYSWNRSLDNVPVVGGPQNPYDNRADRGNSDQVRPHIFTTAYSYDLPFGPGKPFASASSGAMSKLIGGWQVAGITYIRSGVPFSVTFNATQAGWTSSRADLVKDPTLSGSEQSTARWFDTTAFAVPAPFTYGNSARNLLFTPGEIVFDVSLLKNTTISESVTVQFRAEAFNMPNHANFLGPGANVSVPGSLGRITSAGDPRQIQFGLKVLF